MKNLLVAVSGGRTSAVMARHIQQSEKYKNLNKVYVFCNTGMERSETISFLRNIEQHWGIPLVKIEGVYSQTLGVGVRYKVVSWEQLDMTAKPFAEAIAHKNKGVFSGLPHAKAPYCSEMLKTLPAQKFAKDFFHGEPYLTAIGFRLEDMPKRISHAEIKHEKRRIFPLITDFDAPLSLAQINEKFSKEKFNLSIESKLGNCELCWKKSQANLLENIRHGTRFIEWYKQMEQTYQSTSFRGQKSIEELVQMAQMPICPQEEEESGCVCGFV